MRPSAGPDQRRSLLCRDLERFQRLLDPADNPNLALGAPRLILDLSEGPEEFGSGLLDVTRWPRRGHLSRARPGALHLSPAYSRER